MQRTKRGAVAVFLCIGCSATPGDPQDAFETMSETSADDDGDDGDDDDGNDDGNEGPVDDGDDGPADDGPADDGPADDAPADDGPVDDGPADDGTSDDGPADDDGTTEAGEDEGTTGDDEGGETGTGDCMSIADPATCMATEGCEWFGDDMFGACVGGFPGLTDTDGATSGFDTDFGESGFGDFCEVFDMATCAATGFCVWNAGEGVCESP